MKRWIGSAVICVNEQAEVLMVRGEDSDKWSVPTGGIEQDETAEACCIREAKEETGYDIELVQHVFTKKAIIQGYDVTSYYYEGRVTGGDILLCDPDQTIVEVGWKTLSELRKIKHMYPEDRELIESVIQRKLVQLDMDKG